ncbi:MAG: DEAD/DEAH box helicase [Candidatus Micrarchaeia archaeon]
MNMQEKSVYDLFLSKYGSFTLIQKAAIPVVESGSDCLIIAATGSGKTEAAVLPVLNRLRLGKKQGINVIYITPLRALNRDLLKRLEWLAKETGVEIAVRHGDTTQTERQKQAANPPTFLITTPESLQNLFLSKRLKSALSSVGTVIVDEVHELFSNKRGTQLAVALERLAELAGRFQRVGISATIGNVEQVKKWLFASYADDAKVVQAESEKELEIGIEMPQKPEHELKQFMEQFNLNAQALARIERISELVKGSKSALIFANTRQVVESLGNKLIYLDRLEPFGGIGVHHSSLDKGERISVEEAFKAGRLKSIIATSSLELGIDIGSIDLVIQYGSPKQVTRLVQRIGRGGHREHETAKGRVIVANAIDAIESLAILLQAKSGDLERQGMQENAADVLINQLCAMALEYGEMPLKKAYEIIKRSAPYSGLSFDAFKSIADFAAEQKLVRTDSEKLRQSLQTRKYFYANISVIPEIAKYIVKDIASNKIIATLDESFVSNYLDEGTVFITKGMPWRVISIDKDVVQVEQSREIEAAIPDWEGEDIPVTRNTAKKVFELMQKGVSQYKELLSAEAFSEIEKLEKEQAKYFVPSEEKVIVENEEEYSIVYMPLGRPANELLARLLAYAMSIAANTQIRVSATPYALFVHYANSITKPDVSKFLKSGGLLQLLNGDAYLTSSDLFRYRFVQTAKLAGIVDKNATITKTMAQRLLNFYKETPIYYETKRDLLQNYFDKETAVEFLNGLKSGRIKIQSETGVSPFGKELLKANYAYSELLVETHSESEINDLEKEVIGKKVELLCTYCGFVFEHEIKGNDSRILCERCKSPMLCTYSDARQEIWQKRKQGKQLSEKEQEEFDNMMKEASLVEAYGNRALVALSTYGIGLATAARILKMLRKTYRELFIDLLIAQKNFVRTKKYWKQ